MTPNVDQPKALDSKPGPNLFLKVLPYVLGPVPWVIQGVAILLMERRSNREPHVGDHSER
jgi:hypothetical protein